jgi:hypothetical protein
MERNRTPLIIYLLCSIIGSTGTFGQTSPVIVQEKCIGGSDYDIPRRMRVLDNGDLAAIGSSASSDGDVPENFGQLDAWAFIYDILFNPHDTTVIGSPANDKGVDLVETNTGDIVVLANTTGTEFGCAGGASVALIKTTSTGTVIGSTCLSGSLYDEAIWVGKDSLAGHLYVLGNIRSTDGSFTSYTHHGQTDIGLFKYDQNLDLLSGRLIGSSGYDLVKDAMIVGTDLWIFGETSGVDGDLTGTTPYGSDDLVAMKWSLDTWNLTVTYRYGGTDTEHVERVSPRSGGGFVLAGNTWSQTFFTCTDSSSNAFLLAVANDGTVDWTQCIEGSATESISSVVFSPGQGAHFVVGSSNSIDGDFVGGDPAFDAFLAAIDDGNGEVIWKYLFGGSSTDIGRDILELPGGNLLTLSETYSSDGDVQSTQHGLEDAWLVEFEHSTGLADRTASSQALNIAPVPTGDRLILQLPMGTKLVSLYDAQCRQLLEEQVDPSRATHVIDLAGRSPGMYVVRTSGDGPAGHGRCLKQ